MIGHVVAPPPVSPGARVGVAALSGPVDPVRLERGIAALEALGYRPVPARNLGARHGLFAGTDAERLDAFHELVDDHDLEAVFFARGGWGFLRLVEHVDWGLLAARPRAYVGYSDLTPLLLQIPARLGFASFHGPMVAADLARGLSEMEVESLRAALAGVEQELTAEVDRVDDRAEEPIEAPLLGGCLSLLTALVGTPWAVDFDGSLLFVEDVAEPPYRIDRMLTHLRLSGTLTAIRGLIAGHFVDPAAPAQPWHELDVLRRAALAQGFSENRWPLALGLSAGHGTPNLTLPLGLSALLDPVAGRLTVGRVRTDRSTTG